MLRLRRGGVQNVRLLGTDQADIGLSIAATALNGYQGDAPYQQSFPSIRTLIATFQLGYLQMIVLEDSALQSVGDIAGQRVVLGPPGHGAIPRQREVYQEMGISFRRFYPHLFALSGFPSVPRRPSCGCFGCLYGPTRSLSPGVFRHEQISDAARERGEPEKDY